MNKTKLLLSFLMLAPLLTACLSPQSLLDNDYAIENGGAYRVNIEEKEKDEQNSKEVEKEHAEKVEDRKDTRTINVKIVSTLHMEAETVNFDKDFENLENEIHKLQGYIRSHEIIINDKNEMNKEAIVSIRVPKENIHTLSQFIKNTFSIMSEQSQAVDITEDYKDKETRIENLTRQENKLRELYDNTSNIEDILLINDKLFSTTNEKEELIKKLTRIDERSGYSTIELNILEVSELSIPESTQDSTSSKLFQAFSSSMRKISEALIASLVFLVSFLHYILLGGILVILYNKFLKKYVIEMKENEDKSK